MKYKLGETIWQKEGRGEWYVCYDLDTTYPLSYILKMGAVPLEDKTEEIRLPFEFGTINDVIKSEERHYKWIREITDAVNKLTTKGE